MTPEQIKMIREGERICRKNREAKKEAGEIYSIIEGDYLTNYDYDHDCYFVAMIEVAEAFGMKE